MRFSMVAYRILFSLAFLTVGFSELMAQYFDIKEGNEAYKAGEYDKAKESYDKVQSETESEADRKEAIFNNGNVHFRKKEYDKAKENFSSIVGNSKLGEAIRSDAHYNLANTFYEKAMSAEKPEEKQQDLQGALDHLKSAMKLNPLDKDAKQNYEYIKGKLQELQAQSKSQNQKQDDKDKQEDKDKKNDQKRDSKQNQQKQDKKNDEADKNKDQENKEDNKAEQQPPKEFSKQQAEQILDAIKQDEKNMLKKYQQKQTKTKKLDKDW